MSVTSARRRFDFTPTVDREDAAGDFSEDSIGCVQVRGGEDVTLG